MCRSKKKVVHGEGWCSDTLFTMAMLLVAPSSEYRRPVRKGMVPDTASTISTTTEISVNSISHRPTTFRSAAGSIACRKKKAL